MLSKVGGKVLVLTTAPDANLGAVRLEMRDVLQDMATGEE
jgi:predicted regulator of Ras-like GTPase activity (Roadblock/LC7/MglB family)